MDSEPAYRDPVVGNLVRRGRYWRGVINLGSESGVPLLLAGPRAAPGEAGLGLARELGHRYAALLPTIERALFEHYEPYSEAAPRLSRPEQVWTHVSLVRVLIEALGGVDTVEIAYRTEWDAEHTVGARFQGWALTELNGSVI
ncbi:MAG: hypothetical protein WEG40_14380 [Candidatus Rokuibacteriota bacterium]